MRNPQARLVMFTGGIDSTCILYESLKAGHKVVLGYGLMNQPGLQIINELFRRRQIINELKKMGLPGEIVEELVQLDPPYRSAEDAAIQQISTITIGINLATLAQRHCGIGPITCCLGWLRDDCGDIHGDTEYLTWSMVDGLKKAWDALTIVMRANTTPPRLALPLEWDKKEDIFKRIPDVLIPHLSVAQRFVDWPSDDPVSICYLLTDEKMAELCDDHGIVLNNRKHNLGEHVKDLTKQDCNVLHYLRSHWYYKDHVTLIDALLAGFGLETPLIDVYPRVLMSRIDQ